MSACVSEYLGFVLVYRLIRYSNCSRYLPYPSLCPPRIVGVSLPWLAWRVGALGLGWLARVGRDWLGWGALADRVWRACGVGCLSPGAGCVSLPCVRMSMPCLPCHLACPAHPRSIAGHPISYPIPRPCLSYFLPLSRGGVAVGALPCSLPCRISNI